MDIIGNRTLRWLVEMKADAFADREFIVFEDRVETFIATPIESLMSRLISTLLSFITLVSKRMIR